MQSSYDALGDEGRKALNACVKVKIYGKPETRKYDRNTSLERLRGCYAGWNRRVHFHEHFLPSDKHGNFKSSYDIVDIHDPLVEFDKRKCVAKYTKEGPESVKQREVIDKRRADVERELEEAIADPDSRFRYSWVVAQRRVRDCFAGNFAEDTETLRCKPEDSYNVDDIHEAFVRWDKIREKCEAKRAFLEQEYAQAVSAGENVRVALPKYSANEVLMYLRDCYYDFHDFLHDISPIKLQISQDKPDKTQSYDIFDIHKVLLKFDGKNFQKYPKEGPGADELKKLIDKHRADLEEEYQKARNHEVSELPEYPKSEAERRVRDCFAGTLPNDTKIFPKKEIDKSDQTYDIIDIKDAIDHFDTRTFFDAFKYSCYADPGYGRDKINQDIDKQRADIQEEYKQATSDTEIEHGSGFIIHNHFIITNKHVVETYLDEEERHKICISNAAIEGLPCKVAHCDVGKDLALLYCPDLNLEQCGICPLQLSNHSVLPGMSIFAFGYPMSHTEETALFVSGNVSGSKRTLAGHSLIVLNCSLNSGNSGGPVLCWVNGKLKVVGVATQKHFKEILKFEEIETIEKIRESLQTCTIPDVPDYCIKSLSEFYIGGLVTSTLLQTSFLLTLKLYDALETHSQFNLSNAVPGHLVIEFVKSSIGEYAGEHKEELFKVVELANNVVNTS